MSNIELVAPEIYRITVPLPDNPLRALHAYVLTSGERPVLVDLGFDREECSSALEAGLAELGYAFEDVDFFITHSHPDHLGSINRVWRPGCKVYAGFESFDFLRLYFHSHNRGFKKWLDDSYETLPPGSAMAWLSEEEAAKVMAGGYDYAEMGDIVIPVSSAPVTQLRDGDELCLGSRTFRVIHVTGHDPFHLCLFDPEDGVLIAGDQVLKTITPNIVSFALGEDALGDYLRSMDYLDTFDVRRVLPGHRDAYEGLRWRTAELRAHHAERSEEILAAMRAGKHTLKDICRNVSWRNPIPNWDDWPVKQQYFSMGETIAHLSYLEAQGKVRHEIDGAAIVFYPLEG